MLRYWIIGIALSACSSFVSAGDWKQVSPALQPVVEGTAVEFDGKIYLLNGFTTGVKINPNVSVYDPISDTWEKIGETSVSTGNAVTHNATVVVDDNIWLIGGRIGSSPGRVSNTVWIFNITTRQWKQGPQLPRPFAGGGAGLVNNKIYLFGGLDEHAECDVNHHFVLDLNKPTLGWLDISSDAAMPTARNHFSSVVLNGKIYAMGGQHGHDRCDIKKSGDLALVHRFDPETLRWQRMADMPTPQSHAESGTFAYNQNIFMVGGKTNGNNVVMYDPDIDFWSEITELRLEQRRLAPVARIINESIFVFGGGMPFARIPSADGIRQMLPPELINSCCCLLYTSPSPRDRG